MPYFLPVPSDYVTRTIQLPPSRYTHACTRVGPHFHPCFCCYSYSCSCCSCSSSLFCSGYGSRQPVPSVCARTKSQSVVRPGPGSPLDISSCARSFFFFSNLHLSQPPCPLCCYLSCASAQCPTGSDSTAVESIEIHPAPTSTNPASFWAPKRTKSRQPKGCLVRQMAPDPEKAPAATSAGDGNQLDTIPSSTSRSWSDVESPRLEPIKPSYTNRSRPSNASQRLDATDPYENLDHCITPDVETEAERMAREPITYTRTGTSIGSTASRPPEYEVYFEENDPENPRNWPLWYRCWCIFCVSFATWVATMYSTSYTSSTPGLIQEFGSTTTIVTLGMTTYLLGLAAGSLVVAPLSELYGRQIIYIVCLCLWAVLIIPCGLANSLTTIIVVRFIGYVSLFFFFFFSSPASYLFAFEALEWPPPAEHLY